MIFIRIMFTMSPVLSVFADNSDVAGALQVHAIINYELYHKNETHCRDMSIYS